MYYNSTNTCDKIKKVGFSWRRCGNNLHIGSGHPHREKDEKGNWTGNWICHKCHMHDYMSKKDRKKEYRERYISDRRTGNLNPNSTQAKGDRSEELTCRYYDVENLNIKNDNYEVPIDHSKHPILGILQTKGKLYDSFRKCWSHPFVREQSKRFDNLIFYCISKDEEIIERIYIIPKEEIMKRTSISIYKYQNNPRCHYWYEQYRCKDEEVIKKINKIWKEIRSR